SSPKSPPDSSPSSVLAKLWNVEEKEVPKLFAREETLIKGNLQLIPLLDESIYGGSYINLKANKIIINTIDPSKKGIITNNKTIKPYLNFLSFVQVNNSLAKLNNTYEKLIRLARHYKVKDVMISNEYKKNNIVIYLNNTDDKANKAFINSAKKLDPIPIIAYNKKIKKRSLHNSSSLKSRQITIPLLGGSHIGHPHAECTVGFWVHFRGTYYITTCGHCITNGITNAEGQYIFDYKGINPPEYIGPMTMYDLSGVDRGFIYPDNPKFVKSPYIKNPEFRVQPELAIADTTPIAGNSIIGATVCTIGALSNLRCGNVKTGDMTEFVREHEIENMIVTTRMTQHGDSGAPVFRFIELFSLSAPLKVHLIGMHNAEGFMAESEDSPEVIPISTHMPLYKILKNDMSVFTIYDADPQ
ncbi:22297_t:CDS:1, partial [Racocetra persica]